MACAACPGNHVASVLRVRVKDSLWIPYWKPQVHLRLHCSKEARVTVHKRRFFFLKAAKCGLQLDWTLVCFATHATSWLATPCVYFDTDCCNRVYASNELVSECQLPQCQLPKCQLPQCQLSNFFFFQDFISTFL